MIYNFEAQAQNQAAQGKPARANVLRSHLQKKFDLNEQQVETLKKTSEEFFYEAGLIKEQAGDLIKNSRSNFGIDPFKIALDRLEKQRRELPLLYRAGLQKRFSVDFQAFDHLVKDFVKSKAVYRQSPDNTMGYIGLSEVFYDTDTQEVYGYSVTELGAIRLGCGYELLQPCLAAGVFGYFISDVNGQLDFGDDYECLGSAEVDFYISGVVPKTTEETFCIQGEHYIVEDETCDTHPEIARLRNQGSTTISEDCVTVVLEQPTVSVTEVGFKNDHKIIKFADDVPIDPNDNQPVWKSTSNPNHPVSYNHDSLPTAFAKLSVNPAPTSSLSAKIRILNENSNATLATANVTLLGNNVSVDTIQFEAHLDNEKRPKKAEYTFEWEISFDNGQSWQNIGSTTHTFYWTYNTPINPPNCKNDGTPRNCTFVNGQGRSEDYEYPGLYDLALEKALVGLDSNTYSPETITKRIAQKIDEEIIYEPRDGGNPDVNHPLKIYTIYHQGQCSALANLLHGLLRSIGIDSETTYVWGGLSDGTIGGGKVYVYGYRSKNDFDNNLPPKPETFQVSRPQKSSGGENVDLNPHFTFHAMVKLNNQFYDPSYGADIINQPNYPFTEISFLEVANLTNISSPRYERNNATIPFVVKASHMARFCTVNNCDSNTVLLPRPICPHSYFPPTTPSVRTSRFDSDEISDYAIWRPSTGEWYIKKSSDQTNVTINFGLNGDKIVPADYDGDGITDLAVWRPSNGIWHIMQSSNGTIVQTQFGLANDKPVFGDFDGDGKSDIIVFRPSSGIWYWLHSSNNSLHAVQFGLNGDVPVSGDYDGDDKTDITLFRPSNGIWYRLNSSDGSFSSYSFGITEDIPISADFDHDNKTDTAVFRPSDRVWHILRSTQGYTAFQFGDSGDIPSVGDYNGDGRSDAVVWTPSTGRWRILNIETNNISEYYWGVTGDIPVPSAFNR